MQVAEGVQQFEDQGIVNWYLVETDEGPIAIDAGFPSAYSQVEPYAPRLRAVLITHAHVDHLGFAERLRRDHGVPVYMPEADAQLARSPLRYAKSERLPVIYAVRYGPTRRLYWRALKVGAIRGDVVRDFKTYGDGAALPGGLKAVATPGHTFGHMALHLPDRRVLFAGDALVTKDPYTDREGPRIVARAATADSERARASLDRIAATDADVVLTGHGPAWTQGAAAAAAQAAAAPVA
jgi:glyoxylase-like metal-dependent hydrolase (beta-lactamase superfamily II)